MRAISIEFSYSIAPRQRRFKADRVKGIIFCIFEEFIIDACGDEAFEAILEGCSLNTKEPFVGPVTYPDEDLLMLLSQACKYLDVSMVDALRALGKFSFSRFALTYPRFLEGMHDAKAFLLTVHDVIHVEVMKLHEEAAPPAFDYEDLAPNQLIMRYKSSRKLCHLVEGLLDGVGVHFGTAIEHRQQQCMLDGAQSCEFHLVFKA